MLSTDAHSNDTVPATRSELRILIEPIDVTCKIGSSINISAKVRATNPTFQWFNKYGKPIPKETHNSLKFKSVQKQHFGFYKLEIVDTATREKVMTRWVRIDQSLTGTGTGLGTINTPDKPIMRPIKPILFSSPAGGSYKMGSTFTLTAHFRYATSYQWYKDGKRLEGCNGNNLGIHRANLTNNGVYILGAVNFPSSGTMVFTEPIKVYIL